jgi:hypothetical protein
MREIARVDGNQAEIVSALRVVGAHVHSLHQVGGGCPDLLVCFDGKLYLMEVKASKGRLTDEQKEFMQHFPVSVVRTITDALRAIGVME